MDDRMELCAAARLRPVRPVSTVVSRVPGDSAIQYATCTSETPKYYSRTAGLVKLWVARAIRLLTRVSLQVLDPGDRTV